MKNLPDIDYLKSILTYNPETGLLHWLERSPEMFEMLTDRSRDHAAAIWNSANANKEALRAINRQGYKVGNINGSMFRSHRVAYAMHFGFDPANQIDHINGNRVDNRISNLRLVTNAENARNQKLRSTNTSGYNGVYFCKVMQSWAARATIDGKNVTLGYYETPEAASVRRQEFNVEVGFHENHGVAR